MATPKHYIYASDNATLVYTINNVIRRDPPIVIDVPQEVEITSLRSQGAVTISGGILPYDITLEIVIQGTDYADLMTNLAALQSTVLVKTNYYLKYDKNLINNNSLESIRVRLKSITPNASIGNLTKICYVTLIFRALAW